MGPGLLPGFQCLQEWIRRLCLRRVRRQLPLQLVTDQHRRLAAHRFHQRDQVGIGQHDAAVAGFGKACELIRWRSMQPYAIARAIQGLVPVIGVVERERALAIEVGQPGSRNLAADEVNTLWRSLVAFL
ncbi:hypothetical protein D3C81_1883690 [compost metagenome]